MEYTLPQRSSLDPPETYVQGATPSDLYRSSSRSNSQNPPISPTTPAKPMSIPSSRDPPAPPPLPPPKFPLLENNNGKPDIAYLWGKFRDEKSCGRPPLSVNPGSSLYGNFARFEKSITEEPLDFNRRGSSASTIKSISKVDMRRDLDLDLDLKIDEGYGSFSGTSIGSNSSRLMSRRIGFPSSVHEKFQSNASQAYDKSLLQKLDSRRGADNSTPPRGYPRSPFSSSLNDASPTSGMSYEHQHLTQKPLSMPTTSVRIGSMENPFSRWADGGPSAIPHRSHYGNGHYNYRSPIDRDEMERSPLPYLRRSASGSLSNSEDTPILASRSNKESYDKNVDTDTDFPIEESSKGLRRLHIDDSYGHSPLSTAGQKRRASSPPREDGLPLLHTVGSASDLFRRRESVSRASPAPRLHSSHDSVSSVGSGPRNSSYASTPSLTASSIITMSSYGRPSPGGLSPCGLSPGGVSPRSTDGSNDSPRTTSNSLTASPHGSIASPNRQHALSESRPLMTARKSSDRGVSQVKRITTDKFHGVFICECCPKKPKKFETEEELIAHEMEKQYECHYCKNRFKNKNEAERHQNSLHLRRHSWSCAALSDYNSAFHNSTSRPAEADTCGYCGEEFLRTGVGLHGIEGKIATERDREARLQHLVDVHKFRECNHAKKFFRADHFRQHLKHSHAGASGKWTNMLENACMKDEPLPEPLPGRITEEDEETR